MYKRQQFIGGREATQEEFFHTFNALVDQGRQIVLSADKSPSDLEGVEDRLKSRLNCGLVGDIHATTYELRLAILESKEEKMRMNAPSKVLEFLAHKITANVRELEGALNRVAAHTQLVGRELTLETCQEVLHDLLRANDRRVTIEEIQKEINLINDKGTCEIANDNSIGQIVVSGHKEKINILKNIENLSEEDSIIL